MQFFPGRCATVVSAGFGHHFSCHVLNALHLLISSCASQCRECLRSLGVTAQVLMPLSWLQTVLGFYGWIWVFVSSQRLRDTFCWSWYWTRGSHPDRLPGVWCSYSSICPFPFASSLTVSVLFSCWIYCVSHTWTPSKQSLWNMWQRTGVFLRYVTTSSMT